MKIFVLPFPNKIFKLFAQPMRVKGRFVSSRPMFWTVREDSEDGLTVFNEVLE